uniref:Uncharacterized protein n=1 Tax=Naja naja TaxID=35670 RepID=A0A8C6VH31_NAJNA
VVQGQWTDASSPPEDAHMTLHTTFSWMDSLNYCGWERSLNLLNEAVGGIQADQRYDREKGEAAPVIRAQAAVPINQPGAVQQVAAAQRPSAGGMPPLEVKYGEDPRELGFFLALVWNHMEEYGKDFSSEAAKVRCVTKALEGMASKWMVTLHNDNAPQLMNYDLFMAALHARFEGPLAERRARIWMKTINQGRCSVKRHRMSSPSSPNRLQY